MEWTRRVRLKTVGICLGALVTVKVGPMAILATAATASQLLKHPLSTLWPALGLLGLIGFWLWAFSRQPLSGSRRVAVSTLVVTGIATISPFLSLGGALLAVAGTGMIAGVLALAEMWPPRERSGF